MKWFITEKTKQEKITTLWLNKETSFIQSYMHIVDIYSASLINNVTIAPNKQPCCAYNVFLHIYIETFCK